MCRCISTAAEHPADQSSLLGLLALTVLHAHLHPRKPGPDKKLMQQALGVHRQVCLSVSAVLLHSALLGRCIIGCSVTWPADLTIKTCPLMRWGCTCRCDEELLRCCTYCPGSLKVGSRTSWSAHLKGPFKLV